MASSGRLRTTVLVLLITIGMPPTDGNAQQECENGILDPGKDGVDVVIYRLCPAKLTVGFEQSDVIEEISCKPHGVIEAWFPAADEKCSGRTPPTGTRTYELSEPLNAFDRVTAMPVKQLLTCEADAMNTATIVIPDAKKAILETRKGDTKYERVTRRFIFQCETQSGAPQK